MPISNRNSESVASVLYSTLCLNAAHVCFDMSAAYAASKELSALSVACIAAAVLVDV